MLRQLQIRSKSFKPWGLLPFYFLFFFEINSWAQPAFLPEDIKFQTVIIPGGQEANMVEWMTQDSLGFIWIASRKGVHRYNGRSFRQYFFGESEHASEEGDFIQKIIVDSDGNYWAGSHNGGLYNFDLKTGAYKNFDFPEKIGKASARPILDLVEGPEGKLWITTLGGIWTLDREKESFSYTGEISVDGQLSELGRIATVIADQRGSLWFGAGQIWSRDIKDVSGLIQYLQRDRQFKLIRPDAEMLLTPGEFEVSCLYEDQKGLLWIGTATDGLFWFDPVSHEFNKPAFRGNVDEHNYQTNPVTSITEDKCGRLWVSVLNEGLYCYHPETGQSRLFTPDLNDPYSLQSNKVWKLFTSQDGVIWIAGGRTGAFLQKVEICDDRKLSGQYDPILNDYQVSAIEKDQWGTTWIGTQHHGIFRYDPEAATLSERLQAISGLNTNSIKVLRKDREGNIWVGCWPEEGGLIRIGSSNGEIEVFKHDPDDPHSLSNNLVMDILEDQNGKLWVATWGGGLNHFDPASGDFIRYMNVPSDSTSLAGNYVISLHEDRNGDIWVGGGGTLLEPFQKPFLDRFKPETRRFEHYFNLFARGYIPYD